MSRIDIGDYEFHQTQDASWVSSIASVEMLVSDQQVRSSKFADQLPQLGGKVAEMIATSKEHLSAFSKIEGEWHCEYIEVEEGTHGTEISVSFHNEDDLYAAWAIVFSWGDFKYPIRLQREAI